MITVTIQIGNTDDKLSQAQWSRFVDEVRHWLERRSEQIHFAGCSPGGMPWQNACFVAEVDNQMMLRSQLRHFAAKYGQESIALTIGRTEFIRPRPAQIPSSEWGKRTKAAHDALKEASRHVVQLPPGWPWSMATDWLYRNWTIDCFSVIHDQATLFNRTDPVIADRSALVSDKPAYKYSIEG